MALIYKLRLSRCFARPIYMRFINQEISSQTSLQFSTSRLLTSDKNSAAKYSENKASKLKIAEILGFKSEDDIPDHSNKIIAISFVIFLIYFCILREENDMDEILKGTEDFKLPVQELVDLKLKLTYCKQMNLPTGQLQEKIKELEEIIKSLDKKNKIPA